MSEGGNIFWGVELGRVAVLTDILHCEAHQTREPFIFTAAPLFTDL